MELSNENIEIKKGILIDDISQLVKNYVKLFEPTKVYLHILNKEPITNFLKNTKAQSIGYNFGVLASIYDIDKDQYPVRFYFWRGNVLESSSVVINKDDAEVMAYIAYPREICFSNLIQYIENKGYFKDISYNGKPLFFNKY